MALPTPQELRELLAVMQDSGAAAIKVTGSAGETIEARFDVAPEAATPFVDKDGKAINLDDGMPELAGGDPIAAANLAQKAS